MSTSMFLFVACLVFPLLSFALPSAHTHPRSFHPRLSYRPRLVTYYADWAPPQSIDYSLFDTIIFAFALPDQNYGLGWDTAQAPSLLSNLISSARPHGTKVSLSIGGWTGSRWFSEALATPQHRDIFVNSILDIYNHFSLDGIDIDWEYPGQIVQPDNSESSADSNNMLEFFKALRQGLPPNATISAAVQDTPFVGQDGKPMKDVSAFAPLLDWVTLMNYDVYETRQPPGPNAPLSDACANSEQPDDNAAAAYNSWTSAGFPADRILLGVPAYGYVVQSRDRKLSERSRRAYSEDNSGQIQFRSLLAQGILTQNSDGTFTGSSGFTRQWDNCSSTPFLYSDDVGQVIPYDDPDSLAIKASWVRRMKLGGVNMFDAHGDTSQYHLAHSLFWNLFPGITPPTSLSSSAPLPPNAATVSVPSSAMSLLPSATFSPVASLPNQGLASSSSPSLSTPIPGS